MSFCSHSMTRPAAAPTPAPNRMLQRKCACGGTPGHSGECEQCRKKRLERSANTEAVLQRRAVSGAERNDARQSDEVPPIVYDVLRSPGRPLDAETRAYFEPRFGHDFSRVRVHDDGLAFESAKAVNALAYTVGSHMAFGAGSYLPASTSGRELIAHELAHVVQQNNHGITNRGSIGIDRADSLLEAQASDWASQALTSQLRVSTMPTASIGLYRRWDPRQPDECADIGNRTLRKIVVEQETPQSVTLHWSDGTLETSGCSTGKGHCCVDSPQGVACDRGLSRTVGSNCTPITSGAEYPITEGRRDKWNFWNTFVPSRGIALHEHPVVDGTPLSHGCVRLPLETARHIFCGALRPPGNHRTMVEVRGFARPQCGHAQLIKEWQGDLRGSEIPGSDGEDYRAVMRGGYGRDLMSQEKADILSGNSSLPFPPRCPSDRVTTTPTPEEERVLPTTGESPTTVADPTRPGQSRIIPGTFDRPIPNEILAASGFESAIPAFTSALANTRNYSSARSIVQAHGQNLFSRATRRSRGTTADTDDRPLYWARLAMSRALRTFQPTWTLTAANRDALAALFENASRGMQTARFPETRALRILISGFDPFGFTTDPQTGTHQNLAASNPSGAAALALDGQTLTASGKSARIEAVIFPVRFADFNAGMVETFFEPFLTGSHPVHMIMTISQGISEDFEVEKYAGRRRTTSARDNLGQPGFSSTSSNSQPQPIPGLVPGPEFLHTTLPNAVRGGLRQTPLRGETEITEIPANSRQPVNRPSSGPTLGSIAVKGSGGNYLSNEIFYRTRFLGETSGSQVPIGHLHTPQLDSSAGAEEFAAARDAIVLRIQKILMDTIPSL